LYNFSKVRGDYSKFSDKLRQNFEQTATGHMDCIENEATRKKYEPKSVKWDSKNKRFKVMTKGVGVFYYSLSGEWY